MSLLILAATLSQSWH